jgi:hypothetical protein
MTGQLESNIAWDLLLTVNEFQLSGVSRNDSEGISKRPHPDATDRAAHPRPSVGAHRVATGRGAKHNPSRRRRRP